jgi:hypothetical protein
MFGQKQMGRVSGFADDSTWERASRPRSRTNEGVTSSATVYAKVIIQLSHVVILFAALRNIRVVQFINASFRKQVFVSFNPI